jgi:hypothetical protein
VGPKRIHCATYTLEWKQSGVAMLLLVLLILVILLVAGGGGYYGRQARWGVRGYSSGLIVMILIIILLVWAVNEITMPPLPMPAGTPSIMR